MFRKDLRRPSGGSQSDVALRRATPEDLPSLVALAIGLGAQHEGYDPTRFELRAFGDGPALEATYRTFFEEALVDPSSLIEVAVRGVRVVGYAFARLEPESFLELAAASGWLHDVFVDAAARGAGVGPRLVASVCTKLEARGATRLRLSVSPHNPRARAAFEGLGFRPTMLEMQRDVRADRSGEALTSPSWCIGPDGASDRE